MPKPTSTTYLNKSIRFYKIYGSLFLFALFVSGVIRPYLSSYLDLLDLLIGLPVLAIFIMAPIGLFYSWKSYKLKEVNAAVRLRYLIGHIIFCAFVLVLLSVVIKDILRAL